LQTTPSLSRSSLKCSLQLDSSVKCTEKEKISISKSFKRIQIQEILHKFGIITDMRRKIVNCVTAV